MDVKTQKKLTVERERLDEFPASVAFPTAAAENRDTGISSQIRTKLRDWAIGQARAGCYSQAAVSSNYSKTLYMLLKYRVFV